MTTPPDVSPAVPVQPGAVQPGAVEPGAVPPVPAPEVPWLRLNRRMLLIHPVQELFRGIIPLAALLVTGVGDPVREAISGAGVVLLITYGIVRWYTTWYRVTPQQVQIRRGLLNKKLSVAPRDRVRTVDVTSPFLHRLLGLGRVVIGTGRTDAKKQHDLMLDGLTPAEAETLRTTLMHRAPLAGALHSPVAVTSPTAGAGPGDLVAAPPDVELVRLRPAWIALAPFTLSGVVTSAVILGIGWRFVNEARLDPARFALTRDAIRSLQRSPLWLDVVQILIAVLVVVTLLSVIGYVLAFSGFRLTRRPDGTLHVERGLITRRQTTLEHRRVRGVELSEPLLLRAVRGARLIAIATGLRVGRGAERGGSMLVPPSPRAVDVAVGAAILADDVALTAPLTGHGAAATRRRFTRTLAPALVIVAVLVVLSLTGALDGWIGVASLLLLPLAALLALDRAHALGHRIGDRYVVTRFGSLVRRRCALDTAGVIGVTVRSSPFQRRAGVCTVALTTAAGRQTYPLTDLPDGVAWDLVHRVLPAVRVPT